MTTKDTIEFKIINVLPDSFPKVSIIFKGHKSNGDPIWNLKKEDFKVYENNVESEIKSLTPISKNKPINVSIVLDHSGSMFEDNSQSLDKWGDSLYSYDWKTGEIILPEGYVSPIDNAKQTTKVFASSFNFQKDFISVIGFSSAVDRILPLSNEGNEIDSVINTMQADGLTALYDAMLAGLKELDSVDGVNILVTLTDGQNNQSKSKWTDVIEMATERNIPIYIIGFGNVNRDTLQIISDTTKGQFIYTETSKSFSEIYSRISKEIQSFYDLKYESQNLSADDFKRDLVIRFLPSDTLDSLKYDFALPPEVSDYLKKRKRRIEYTIGTSIITATVLTSGILIYRRRRRKHASR